MGKVARQMVEEAGVDVAVLLDKLVAAAGAEFTTFYYYTILRVSAIGMEGEGLKEIIEDARIEDRNHFEALTPRIYELGGELPRDIRKLRIDGAESVLLEVCVEIVVPGKEDLQRVENVAPQDLHTRVPTTTVAL